jgi:hypothetical protein
VKKKFSLKTWGKARLFFPEDIFFVAIVGGPMGGA